MTIDPKQQGWFTAPQAARYIGQQYRVVRRLIRAGHLKPHAIPGSSKDYYRRADIDALFLPRELVGRPRGQSSPTLEALNARRRKCDGSGD